MCHISILFLNKNIHLYRFNYLRALYFLLVLCIFLISRCIFLGIIFLIIFHCIIHNATIIKYIII